MSINKHNTPFNVLRHKNPEEVVNRDPVSIYIAGTVLGLTGTAFYIAVGLSYVAIAMVTSAALAALMPKPDTNPNNSQGLLVNSRQPTAPAQFVYGTVRKGGEVTFIETTGSNNVVLHQIITLAAHEIEDITAIYVNDRIINMSNETVTDSPYKRTRYVTYTSTVNGTTVTQQVEVTDYYMKIYYHLGNQTSATDTFANSTQSLASTLHSETSVDSDFIGKGLAYLYCRLEYDKDAFADGVPTFTAVLKGKKVAKTVNGVEQTPVFSNNSAWVMRDFLKSSYGFNDDAIDYASFEAAANICDDTTILSNGDPQYTVDGVVNANQSYGDVLNSMVGTCGGSLFWGSGSWRLHAGAFITPTKTLTLDDFRGPISLDTKVSMRDNFNAVRGTYVDALSGYISSDYPQVNSSLFLSQDNGQETVLDLQLPFTTSSITAQRIAKQLLFRSREQLSLSAEFGMNAFDIEVGDFIKLRNERYGWSTGNEKIFEVTSWKLAPNPDEGDIRISLSLRESSQAAFGFNASDELEIVSNNTTLTTYDDVPSIGVTMSQEYREVNENVVNVLVANIVTDSIERLDSVIVKYRKTSDPDFKSVGQSILIGDANTAGRFEIVGIDVPQISEPPINYTISVVPVNALGFRGDPVITTFNVTSDTTPPSSPSTLTHQLSGGTIFFAWPAVSDLDLSHYKLYYSSNSSANFGDSSTLSIVDKIARPATSVTYPALSGKFFVSSIDKTGNESTTASSSVITPSELPTLNTSQTHTESTSFSGSKTNLTVSGGKLFMTSYSSANSSGTYVFDHNGNNYFDVGTSRTVRLSSSITVARKHLDAVNGEVNWDDIPNNWDTWPDNWDTWTDETANFNDFSVTIEARAGITVSEMNNAPFVIGSGEIVGRYIQFRATLANTQAKITPNISALSATVEY
jgi:hypothetical protein